MMRIATIHVGTAALGCPVKRSSTAGFGWRGAFSAAVAFAALAAEVNE
jgi:hypothetical protein